jgi:hypothetical protein
MFIDHFSQAKRALEEKGCAPYFGVKSYMSLGSQSG